MAGLALALGVLTAYAQGWLPDRVASLANSSGSWVLIAFLLALLGATPVAAAAFGSLSLLSLLTGYVVGAGVRGYPSSTALLLFWGAAGVLVGEGVYGLLFIADTTYPPYWWGQMVVGCGAGGGRGPVPHAAPRRRPRPRRLRGHGGGLRPCLQPEPDSPAVVVGARPPVSIRPCAHGC